MDIELQRAKIDLLRPALVAGLQRCDELEHLLLPLRRSRGTHAIDLPVSRAAHRLLALIDADGFVLALGSVLDTGASTVTSVRRLLRLMRSMRCAWGILR